MNKHFLTKIAAAALLTVGAVAAHAEVSIYGTVDAGLTSVKTEGVGTVTGISSGLKSDNALGFRGTEDLGGGLKANFTLETGFNVDNGANTGASGTLFSREASIGLQNQLGFAKIGQVKTLSAIHSDTFDAFGGSLLGNARDTFDDTGRYASNTAVAGGSIGPVGIVAAHTFGEQAGSTSANSINAFHANYGFGDLKVGLTHTSYDAAGSSTQYGASYDLKVATVFANFESDKDREVDSAYSFGAKVPLAGNLNAMTSFGKKKMVAASSDEKSFAAGVDYTMSKRTSVYSGYKQVDSDATGKVSSLALGVNHKF